MSEWFDQRRRTLAELFDVLELEAPLDDAETLASWCEVQAWYGEHGRQEGRPVFTPDQLATARPLLRQLGLDGQIDPPAEHFDEILVMGAAGLGIHRRIALVAHGDATADRLTVLAGLRPHEGFAHGGTSRRLDGTLSELLAPDGTFAAAPDWQPDPLHVVQQRLLADVDDFRAAALVFPSETDLAVHLLLKHFPHATPTATQHAPPHEVVNELGQRAWAYRTWVNEVGTVIREFRVQNSVPVERVNFSTGESIPSRPTAVSSFNEWLAHSEANDSVPDRVLLVVNQPHLGRILLQVLTELASTPHRSMGVEVAGCATLADADLNLLLGEIPRWIRSDQMR